MSPSALPEGGPVPADGRLPAAALAEAAAVPFGIYLHVPFCATRCGYCDFNTYTPGELGLPDVGGEIPKLVGPAGSDYRSSVLSELALASRVLPEVPPVSTVFVGGGTPTLLPSSDLAALLAGIEETFGLAPGAEITTEANPDSVDQADLARLRAAGFTRISFGMQSAVPHVLSVLDRTHTPGRAQRVARWAREEGFEHVSLDLIYGAPGESQLDWRASLEAALGAEPDHLSAYALIVEPGTRLARRIERGELAAPDDDDHADRYLLADELLGGAGFTAYEVSNWARSENSRCRHNLAYWRGTSWWGLGPGAHSHVGGVRWWNVKHPARYAAALAAGTSPGAGRELLSQEDRRVERVLLELRLADGLPQEVLTATERARVGDLIVRGLVGLSAGRLVLTLQGRLLADAVVRDLLD